ncbi:hypothetical protein ACIRJS_29740 [Streptomyces sp. NPDC102340]|uniref:hypothetical protein n=1 Tax=unclassified Streptomyces TaxID=2593676 RepID=UPI0038056AC0
MLCTTVYSFVHYLVAPQDAHFNRTSRVSAATSGATSSAVTTVAATVVAVLSSVVTTAAATKHY